MVSRVLLLLALLATLAGSCGRRSPVLSLHDPHLRHCAMVPLSQ